MKRRFKCVRVFALAALCVCLLCPFSGAQANYDLSAFLGQWKIDLNRTHMSRGNSITRSQTFTFVFSPQGEGLKLDIYSEYPQPAPTRSSPIIPDHNLRTCQTGTGCLTIGGNPDDESFAYFQVDSYFLVRVFYIKGKVSEYSTYSVSSDGRTFTMIAWGAEAPDRQNIQVFDRQ